MSCCRIDLPRDVAALLRILHRAGHSAYVVGGCVRDSLLGRRPGDWDICTSARPDQIKAAFTGYRLLLTGEKHGTVAVLLHGRTYEITTYRLDGAYTDHRRPDAVTFVRDLSADLARRDFTVNAMAYAPGVGLVDLYEGRRDLERRLVRCVGAPQQRFAEDALRILRAVRFASQLEFTLDAPTRAAALAQRETVNTVAAERIFTELDKLLAGPGAATALCRYGELLTGAVPEIGPCMGCAQTGPWHRYDVWQHTAAAVGALSTEGQNPHGERILRWAALLHDIAKPSCRTTDPDGMAHFHGHNQRGARMSRAILRLLRAPSYLIEGATTLIAIHDAPLPTADPDILRLLNRYGAAFLQRLCLLKYADLDAHPCNEPVSIRRADVACFEVRLRTLAVEGCYTVAQLAVRGSDVMELGIAPGPAVGDALHRLLNAVMDGSLPNEKTALLAAAARWHDRDHTPG